MESTQVRRATRADLDEMTDILTDGFAENPFFAWMFRTKKQYARLAPALFRWMVDQAVEVGDAYIVDGKGTLIGRKSSAIAPEEHWNTVGQRQVRDICAECADNALTYFNAARRAPHHPMDTPHWHAEAIAARSEYRNEAVGIRLLRYNFKEHGMPVYLNASTPQNIEMYSLLGFTVLDSLKISETIELTSMWREPVLQS
ncbi:hypothetical protein [Streptomyces noursei]|uniref:hypothetical protein n=1 Tax=Streptomyces noursei TaxID=1971 RepID=UPI001676F677|nr:hypothetical protein [Streptomyces noursei]MCZ1014103.1 hypothetical protein [Streptomyces noursei]GGX50586.1 hypothetical protein GCM10010341_85250 [Streptomyces noursei]